ncbi:MAG: hypothetical protein ABL958_15235 [Bdellovibrionia bacterium]
MAFVAFIMALGAAFGLPSAKAQSLSPLRDFLKPPPWTNFFPVQPSFNHPHVHLINYFREAAPKQCHQPMKDIIELTNSYRTRFGMNLLSLTESTGDKIIEKLRTSYAQNGTEGCFEAVSLAYAVASVAMFEPMSMPIASYKRQENDPVATNAAYSYIAIYLANSGRVKIIDPALRDGKSCMWRALSADKKTYKVGGAYDCMSRTIFLDPFQRPLNMGAVILHEIDHLFRDAAYDLSRFPGDLTEYLLIDETLAIARAAYLQMHYRDNPGRSGLYLIEPREDLSLYKRGGSFEGIYTSLRAKGPVTMDRFYRESLLPKPGVGLYPPQQMLTYKVYGVVNETYFPGRQLTTDFLSALPNFSSDLMTPLNLLGNRLSGFVAPNDQLQNRTGDPEWYIGTVRNGEPDSNSILRAISWLSRTMATPSKTCFQFNNEVRTTPYLGNQNSQELCESALHPGETGVRPESGVRPGETGVRPEGNIRPEVGVRPDAKPRWGESGVRPGETGVRPCLRLEEKL